MDKSLGKGIFHLGHAHLRGTVEDNPQSTIDAAQDKPLAKRAALPATVS